MSGRQNPEKTQLSGQERVETDVASMAIKTDGISAAIEQQFPVQGAGRRLSPPPRKAMALEKGVSLEELTDAEIMLRVGAGDDAAFDHLVEKFRRPVVSFMYRMTRNQAVAEELAQEVFLRVYRSRETYAAEAKFTTWLYRIATNLAVNHARDTKNERTAPSVSLDEPDEETGSRMDVADKTLTAEQQLLRQERMAAIKQYVMELPERQRLAVLMHKYQEMDYREIAEVLKLSESATKSLLFRAYETLREKLKGFI